jgi:mannose-6-phosphate isomerase-like protein (cupin superfamily)
MSAARPALEHLHAQLRRVLGYRAQATAQLGREVPDPPEAPINREEPWMTEQIRDPISGVRYAFEAEGENLIVHAWLEPGGGSPAHLHPRQTERWSVVEGKVGFHLGNENRVIGPEDGEIVVPPGTKHALASVSDREARLRCVAVPALGLQSFLEESAAAANQGLFTRRRIPRAARAGRRAS